MTTINLTALLELLEDDRELLKALAEEGLIEEDAQVFAPEDVETILISQTLVRELDVNLAGVDVILRLRRQLLMTRLRLAELAKR